MVYRIVVGMRRLALLSDRIERGQVKVYLAHNLAHLLTHRPAHKPNGIRSIPDPHADRRVYDSLID